MLKREVIQALRHAVEKGRQSGKATASIHAVAVVLNFVFESLWICLEFRY